MFNVFCEDAKNDPDFLSKYGDANIPITVPKHPSLDMIKKNHAVSITFNNWLADWIEKREDMGKRELKKLRKNTKKKTRKPVYDPKKAKKRYEANKKEDDKIRKKYHKTGEIER